MGRRGCYTPRDGSKVRCRWASEREVVLAIRDWMIAQMQLDMDRIGDLLR